MPRTYEVLVSDIVARVRHVIQDESPPYRTTDAELIRWLNDALKTLATLVPQLFIVSGSHTCVAGSRQTLENTRAMALFDVLGVPEADLAALTLFSPGWQNAAPGAIQNWLRPVSEPLSFYTYPPSTAGQALPIMFVQSPAEITALNATVPVPESYEPALVGYIVGMAESKNDESVDMNRAQTFMADFVGRVKGA